MYIQWDISQPQKGSKPDTHYIMNNTENIMLSEGSQTQKDKCCDCTYIWYPE